MEDTFPSKLSGMDLPTMEACHCFLVDIQPEMTRMVQIRPLADRIDLLRREIELKRNQQQSERHHQDNKNLLWWTIGLAALSVIVGIAGVLQQHANKQTSTAAPSPIGVLPAITPSPQIAPLSPTASPAPAIAPTEQPSQTPQLWPPPAP